MKKDGVTLNSLSGEVVYIYRERSKRTVFQVPDKWEFYVKVDGQFIRVYRKYCPYSCYSTDVDYGEIVKEALENFAKNPEGIENFCSYLSIYFAEWLNKYANTPEGLASELLHFSKIGYNEEKEG